MQTKVLPLCSLTVLVPSLTSGHVRPGAAAPCGYPSSGFAPIAGEIKVRANNVIKNVEIRDLDFKIMVEGITLRY